MSAVKYPEISSKLVAKTRADIKDIILSQDSNLAQKISYIFRLCEKCFQAGEEIMDLDLPENKRRYPNRLKPQLKEVRNDR